eukprot:554024-Pelagomonas_calceolata.AAC.4
MESQTEIPAVAWSLVAVLLCLGGWHNQQQEQGMLLAPGMAGEVHVRTEGGWDGAAWGCG